MPAKATIDFRKSTPQLYADDWRGGIRRVCEFKGACLVCGRRTFAFTDGDNDPRGVLGDHTMSPLGPSDSELLKGEHPLCAICANDYDSYKRGIAKAVQLEHPHPRRIR